MKQLKMKWKRKKTERTQAVKDIVIRPLEERDIPEWLEIMSEAIYGRRAVYDDFERDIKCHDGYRAEGVLVAEIGGKTVASTTAMVLSSGEGYIHMVGCDVNYRGRGLGTLLLREAMSILYDKGCEFVTLTTDDFRVPAIKSYLRAGFLPVLNDVDMRERWSTLAGVLGAEELYAYDGDDNSAKLVVVGAK